VAELCIRIVPDIGLYLFPAALIIAYFLAGCTDRQENSQGLYLRKRFFACQILRSSFTLSPPYAKTGKQDETFKVSGLSIDYIMKSLMFL